MVLVTAPAARIAQFIGQPTQVVTLSGSLWSGRATLQGGLVAKWQGQWSGLIRGRLGATVEIQGPRTLLDGRIYASPWQIGLQDLSGRAGPEVLALGPNAAPCEGQAIIDIASITVSRSAVSGDGFVRISESTCQPSGGPAFTTPPLHLVLTSEDESGVATLTTDDTARDTMGRAQLGPDGWVKLRIDPNAARLMPGLPTSAPTELEFQLYTVP